MLKKILIGLIIAVVYLVTAVPVGLAVYSLKSNWGWDVFSKSGYHAVEHCLVTEYVKMRESLSEKDTTNE